MENFTFNGFMLQLEGLKLPPAATYPVFLFFFLYYIFMMAVNASIAFVILFERNLHQPMYLLFCNVPVNDMVGNSVMVPRLLRDLLRPPSARLISYYECVAQGFGMHMFATVSHTVLMAMAFDRYVAICDPLHYAAIMTRRTVLKLTLSAWGAAFVWVAVLFGLTVRLSRCRTLVTNPYCDNPSLFKLSCESVLVNNVFGVVFALALFSSSVGSIVFTYARIAVACLTSRNKSLNKKALKTCSTHLIVYLILLTTGVIVIVLHRFPRLSDQRKFTAILLQIIPSSLNPLIYGVQSAEILRSLSKLFHCKAAAPLLRANI